jgi:hypothetical protein
MRCGLRDEEWLQHLAVDDHRGVEVAVEGGERVARGRDRHADRGFLGEAGAVRGEDQVVEGKQGTIRGRRLLVEDVERGACDFSGCQSLVKGGLVDDAAAGGVDHEGVRGESEKLLGADQAPALRAERHVDRQDVDFRENSLEGGDRAVVAGGLVSFLVHFCVVDSDSV